MQLLKFEIMFILYHIMDRIRYHLSSTRYAFVVNIEMMGKMILE